jgi:hypothetical protein
VLNKGTTTPNRFDDNITKADLEQVGGFMATPKTHARFESTYELSSFRVLNELLSSTAMLGNIALLCLILLIGVELNPGPRSNRSRRNGRRGSQRGSSRTPMVIQTPSEAFAERMSRGDAVNVVTKHLAFNQSVSGTPTALFNVTPTGNSLGTRLGSFCGLYSRYRFKSVRIRYLDNNTNTSTTAQFLVCGILDDTTASGTVPTTVDDVMNLRCSAVAFGDQTVPTEFTWRPLDSEKWYYTSPESTTSDSRFEYPAAFYVVGSTTATATIEIDVSIVFKGAADST